MEDHSFDPNSLVKVRTLTDIERLSADTEGVFVFELNDEKLSAIGRHIPKVRHLVADANTGVTDAGLIHLQRLSALESLDLEWSGVTDSGLPSIAAVQSLRWVDLGYCKGITEQGASELQRVRPDLEAIFVFGCESVQSLRATEEPKDPK
jgi:hypothetical protein